ncbi:MAG: hypothetical protein QOJ20_1915 [Mycobacterium sp.]|jgi:hypothetical protein|nr:hypothetical protein [Mycobacterium sp.]MDT5280720.1 hypothetical protein [Mycobacterium sp.]
MKKTIIAGIAGAAVAAGLGLAAPAQATPCSYFGSGQYDKSICGVPDLPTTVGDARTNLRDNLSLQQGLENLQKNVDPGTAGDNLKKNLGLGG